ncbi:MAG: cytochrome b/b6 domain-containing protein [Syntrophothermus sp.]|uniref:formate dehydrogenase subunit gamma n=1 Tax=Syntrophothermus sp. TaxID=2736299 RepID=UPI00257FBCD7|nr:cytochrome b/b6 domain-containing protein [Syntrophothermus sp.]NSW81897.1 cytochrome b/b6 domain-containing protein [Syntrophothermus sp.]
MSTVKGKVLKHAEQTRTMHWVHLICFIILGLTGIGFHWHVSWINNLFGGPANASLVHRWTAVVFTAGPAVYILLNFERFSKFIDTISSFSADDFKWLKTMGGYLPFLKGEVPPQDKYNAGQKLLGWVVIFGCLVFILTGYPMWFWRHDVSPAFLNFCYNVHFWDAIIMILAVAGHFFLAAIHPKSRVEFSSMMLDGYVDAEFTSHHNGRWFAQLSKTE